MKQFHHSLAGGTVVVVLLSLSMLTVPLGGRPVAAAPGDSEDAIQIFNRDVYALDGATLRNPTAETSPDAPLYSNVGAILPVTWGQWSNASATSTVRSIGGPEGPRTDVRLQLRGLIPGGVYSVFYGTFQPDSENPLCPGVERTLALTASHPERQLPDPSSFVADDNGEAGYRGRVNGVLLDATQVFFSVIYHFDGMTYHPLPNRGEFLTQGEECRTTYGLDAMRHVVVLQKW